MSKSTHYLLVETFEAPYFERKLFRLNSSTSYLYWDEIPLDDFEPTKWKESKLIIDNLDRIVIKKEVEDSILSKIKTIIHSIDWKLMEADKNFRQYTDQFKIFRDIVIPDSAYTKLSNWTKTIDWDKLWKNIQTQSVEGANSWLEIIKNTNELLNDSLEFIDKQIIQISSITSIPLFAFWQHQESWNDSWTSKIKSSWIFYKKIEKYRDHISQAFNDFWELYNIPQDKRILKWNSITTSDPKEIIENENIKLENWTISRKKAIMKQEWVDEQQAEEILEEIQQEKLLYNIDSDDKNSDAKED